MEILELIFFSLRLYTAVITLAAAGVIYAYSRLVKNPNFTIFVSKFWVLLLILGLQGLWAIFQAHFPLTDENMIFIIMTACVKSWIFFGYLPMYLQQQKQNHTPFDNLSLEEKVQRSKDILDYR